MAETNTYGLDAEVWGEMPYMCACFNVRRASRAITQFYDESLGDLDIKPTQFSLLVSIMFMGDAGVSTIAEGLGMDRTTASRGIRSLEKRGLIEPVVSDDRRTHAMRLTAEGAALLKAAYPRWVEAQERLRTILGADKMNALLNIMGEVAALPSTG